MSPFGGLGSIGDASLSHIASITSNESTIRDGKSVVEMKVQNALLYTQQAEWLSPRSLSFRPLWPSNTIQDISSPCAAEAAIRSGSQLKRFAGREGAR